jgi:hypothetical protein
MQIFHPSPMTPPGRYSRGENHLLLGEIRGIFSQKLALEQMMQSIESKVVARIYGHRRGWSFSAKDFIDLGTRKSVDNALLQLYDNGRIRRVIRGIYDYPRYSELLQQQLSPDIHQVARAMARKFGWRTQPDGFAAMNLLGLTTQVPSQYVFHSDGPDRQYQIGQTTLTFKHSALKEMGFAHEESGVVVYALKTLGEKRIDEFVVAQIRNWLPEAKRRKILKDTERVTGWVHETIKQICKEAADG